MKIRDISLIATGAIISVALLALAFTLFNPPKAEAQAASGSGTAGSTAMSVTLPTNNGLASTGVISINDSTTKKVTVVAYYYNSSPLPPVVRLSVPATFVYQ